MPGRRKKRKRNKPMKKLGTGILGIALLLLLLLLLPASRRIEGNLESNSGQRPSKQREVLQIEIESPYGILLDRDSKQVLFEKDSQQNMYPASLTKIMTVLVAIEELKDLDETVTLSSRLFQPLYQEGASMAGFQPGEEVKVRDLLYGAMLPSGAECCEGLAVKAAGTEQKFVKLMNQKAKSLKMTRTHFTNTTGLHDKEHYSTAEDMAMLLDAALKEPVFREVFTTSRYSTGDTNMHPGGITFYSTLSQSLSDGSFSGGEILGGKTGYTKEAGLCLATLAKKNGTEYILVTAKAKGDHQTEPIHVDDALTVYNSIP